MDFFFCIRWVLDGNDMVQTTQGDRAIIVRLVNKQILYISENWFSTLLYIVKTDMLGASGVACLTKTNIFDDSS